MSGVMDILMVISPGRNNFLSYFISLTTNFIMLLVSPLFSLTYMGLLASPRATYSKLLKLSPP